MFHSRWMLGHVTSHKSTPCLLQFYPVWRKLFGFLGGKGTPGDVVQDLPHDGFCAAQTAARSIQFAQELASQLLGPGPLVQVAGLARKFHEISIIIWLRSLASSRIYSCCFPGASLESRLNQDDTNQLMILGQGGVWWGILRKDARRRSHQ